MSVNDARAQWFEGAQDTIKAAFREGAIDAHAAKDLAMYLGALERRGPDAADPAREAHREALLAIGIDIDELDAVGG